MKPWDGQGPQSIKCHCALLTVYITLYSFCRDHNIRLGSEALYTLRATSRAFSAPILRNFNYRSRCLIQLRSHRPTKNARETPRRGAATRRSLDVLGCVSCCVPGIGVSVTPRWDEHEGRRPCWQIREMDKQASHYCYVITVEHEDIFHIFLLPGYFPGITRLYFSICKSGNDQAENYIDMLQFASCYQNYFISTFASWYCYLLFPNRTSHMFFIYEY